MNYPHRWWPDSVGGCCVKSSPGMGSTRTVGLLPPTCREGVADNNNLMHMLSSDPTVDMVYMDC